MSLLHIIVTEVGGRSAILGETFVLVAFVVAVLYAPAMTRVEMIWRPRGFGTIIVMLFAALQTVDI